MSARSVLGSGDVKYHMGATGEYATRSGKAIHLVSNLSRSRRSRHRQPHSPNKIAPARRRENICRSWSR
jgi:hypothetical protein